MKKLILILTLIPTLSFAGIPEEITSSMKPFAPIKISIKNKTITIKMNERRITDKIYEAVIKNGICMPQWLGKKGYLNNIKEIAVLNRFSKQGYVFENAKSACTQIGKAKGKTAGILLMGNTHWY